MTTTRDTEMDALMEGLGNQQPHIEKPDELSIQDGTTCWLNQDRECATDCRAYDVSVDPSQGPEVCTLLQGAMNLRGLVPIVQLLTKPQRPPSPNINAPIPSPTGRTP